MNRDIQDLIEHCPVCGKYYTEDDAGCACAENEPQTDDPKFQNGDDTL
jgi:hypothetical protein